MLPQVSVITPAYNAASSIRETVRSVQDQTFRDWEMIVVDDGSSDGTAAHVSAMSAEDSRVKLVRHDRNSGIAAARNTALALASGRFIAFLDGDDLWDPAKLDDQLAVMREKAAAFSFTSYRLASARGAPLGRVTVEDRPISYREMLRGFRVGCLTVMIDRERIGDFRFPAFEKASDLGGWLAILGRGNLAHGISRELATYRVLESSISRRKAAYVGSVWDVYKAQPLSTPTLALCYAEYALRGLVKHVTSGAVRVRAK